MVKVACTQAIHESGFNTAKGGSTLADDYNNLFGIKGSGTDGFVSLPTNEYEDGAMEVLDQDFAAFLSVTDCFKAHRVLMEKPRYTRVLSATTPEDAFKQLYYCGYATDPAYAGELINLYHSLFT